MVDHQKNSAHRTLKLVLVIVLFAFSVAPAGAIECVKPDNSDRDLEIQVDAAIGQIGRVKAGALQTQVKNATRQILTKVPNADRVMLEHLMYFTYCTTLRDDMKLSEADRRKALADYNAAVRNALRPPAVPKGGANPPAAPRSSSAPRSATPTAQPPLERHTDTSVQFQRPEVLRGIPLNLNTPFELKQVVINRGPETARSMLWGFDTAFTERAPSLDTEKYVWDAFMAKANLHRFPSTGPDLGTNASQWATLNPISVTARDKAALEEGRMYLYVTGLAIYRDRVGELVSELCVYLQPPGNAVGWRLCESHNVVGRVSQIERASQ
jgi:hypothetical protein